MEEESKILSSVENGVGRLIFNNPQRRNAMSLEMWETTSRTLEAFDQNPEVRVIVLSGAGGKAFVSGADISKFESERSSVEQTLHYNEVTAETSRVHTAGFPCRAQQGQATRAATGELACAARSS